MNNQTPVYKPSYKYNNLGIAISRLVYAKEMTNKEGVAYGYELLLNCKDGSMNVRIPKMDIAQKALDNYPVIEKPMVRVGLTKLSQFTSQKGVTYTNLVSFVDVEDAVDASGNEMAEGYKGRVGGEVYNINRTGSELTFNLIVYSTDKDGSLVKGRQGQPYDPDVLQIVVKDPEVEKQFVEINEGANIEVGYQYINKDDVSYDEFGFPVGSGERIEYIEAAKVVVHYNTQSPNQQQGFNQQPQGQQANGFSNMQQQPNQFQQQQPNQFQQQPQQFPPQQDNNPWANQAQPASNDVHQQAEQIFGQQGTQFPFGQ